MKKAIIIPIILSSLFFVLPKVASAATNLGFNLNHQNLVVGQTFTADIIAQSSDIAFYSANFEISFDRALINLTTVEISAGSLLGCSNGAVAWSDPYNLDTGAIMVQVFRSGCSPLLVTDSTTLVRLNFTAIGAGATPLAFTDVTYYLDSSLTEETSINTSSSPTITVFASDAVNPSLTISTASGSTDTSPVAITGTVSDNVEVTQVAWSNDLGGSGQATIIGGNWTFDAPLQVGDNDITVTATDTSSNTSSDTITITYAPTQAVVSLNPAVQNVNIGGTFTVALRVGNAVDLDNMNVNINFDSTKLSYINFDLPQDMTDSGWDVFTDYCYDEEFNPISSCINILASANIDLPQAINGSANIVVLNFTANAIGINQFTFDEILSVLYATGSFDTMLTIWNPATATIVDLSSDKAITAFNFTSLAVTGSINETDHTIALTVPYGTAVTALVPTITMTGATVNPTSGTAQNFTLPVIYTVTAANATTQAYVVTVTVAANSDLAAVAADQAALVDDYIKGTNSSLSNIIVALTNPLPSTGANGSTITWVSNNTSVVSNNGQTINRPAFASGNATVTLTATLTKGVVTNTKVFTLTIIKTKVFTLTIIKQAASTVATVTSATYTVGATTITNVPFATSKATFLAALTKGETNQTWNSSNIADPVVTGNTLVVTAQDETTIITYTVTVVVDNLAPSMPTGLSASANSSSQISLSWTASSDNIGVTGYNIFRNSTTTTAIATTTGISFSDSGLSPVTQYTYYIRAIDAVGNTSEFSAGASATTENASPPSVGNNSGGGGGSSTTYCSSVTYRDWGSCINGFQYRIASSSLPIGCSLTTAQQLDSSRTCVALASEVLGVKIDNPEASANVPLTQLEQIQADAATVYNCNKFIALNATTKALYDFIVKKSPQVFSDQNKYAIACYIHNDLPTTKKLGAGERTGVLNSYLFAFGKLPKTIAEWQDVIKIANGRWPSERSTTAETKAKESFKKIYGREANMSNTNDNAAVTVMAYGLRPSQRNLSSEKAAILSFKYFMKRAPTSAPDWDIVRAIAYSGAKR